MFDWLREKLFSAEYWSALGERLLGSMLEVILVLAFYAVMSLVIRSLTSRLKKPVSQITDPARAQRLFTLSSLIRSAFQYVLTIITAIMLLRAFGIDVVPLITAAGVAGLAIGFGAQKLVRDVINGFFILLENQFAVGERVSIGVVNGTVIEMGLRITRIRGDDGQLYILSNGDINQICNHSRPQPDPDIAI